ncbi:conserved protein, unknown function [Plasmodium ovale wallikeri]|uniref:DUF155 domain-containing protein n=1 Tax=Plasmodium ovale wallikeri TaxID=864142 RepID=A0A1A8YL30_PLAOA|nr:conserved protein, unknown function [Plasmodium ovale wallikeri]
MYVLFKDQLKNEGEQNENLQITRSGKNNSSSENENALSSKYFRKENRRFKHNLNLELTNDRQSELGILRIKHFSAFIRDFKTHSMHSDFIKIKKVYSEVIFCSAFEQKKIFFLFRFGCIVLWDFNIKEKEVLFMSLKAYLSEAYTENNNEVDSMFYIMNIPNNLCDNKSAKGADSHSFKIKNDMIYIYTKDIFEKLSYSYAFAQSVKLSYFENVVDDTIEKTKDIPECLARTGKIQLKKNDISKKIGELFVNRFYINMNTDILDTPGKMTFPFDEIHKKEKCVRKNIDNSVCTERKLDIIKDLYDMLQNELTIQHGYKLEWIVIYLICIEVVIDIVWTIIIKGVFKWG